MNKNGILGLVFGILTGKDSEESKELDTNSINEQIDNSSEVSEDIKKVLKQSLIDIDDVIKESENKVKREVEKSNFVKPIKVNSVKNIAIAKEEIEKIEEEKEK